MSSGYSYIIYTLASVLVLRPVILLMVVTEQRTVPCLPSLVSLLLATSIEGIGEIVIEN